MSSSSDKLTELLKAQGYSVTKPRMAVFKALLGSEPVSMHKLVQLLPAIDRASIYRTVSLYEELGIILRINIGWKYKLELSDAFSEHHHHLSCTVCGATIPINEARLESLIIQLSNAHSFQPESHQIEIQGVCQTCHTKNQRV